MLHSLRIRSGSTLLVPALFAASAWAQIPEVEMVFPAAEWQVAAPAAVYVDAAALTRAVNTAATSFGSYGTRQMMVIRKGRVIWQGPEVGRRVNIYSSTKSLVSTLLGTLVDQGVVGLDSLAKEQEPLLATHYPALTYRHFVTMTSGYDSVNTPAGIDMYGYVSEDRSATPYLPKAPLFAPGTKSCYWEENMLMFGRVLTNIVNLPALNPAGTPRTLRDYLQEKILGPIGVPAATSTWYWDTIGANAAGVPINHGGAFIHLPATHLARFGHLMLNRGQWAGARIISAAWVEQATSLQVPYSLPYYPTSEDSVSGAYGFNFWVNGTDPDPDSALLAGSAAPASTFWTWGYHNNLCFVIPEWDMVVVRTSGGGPAEEVVDYERDYVGWKAFFNLLAPGIYHNGLRATYCNFPEADIAAARPPAVRLNERTRVDSRIDFDWGTGSPVAGVAPDHFYSEWNGFYRPSVSGPAYLYAGHNDLIQVQLDLDRDGVFSESETVLNQWTTFAAGVVGPSAALDLQAGAFYRIRVRALERTFNARALLYRRSAPGVPTAADLIPAADFCHR